MADKYRIDSHKLMFHPERVASWLAGENIYPIYVEIGPAGLCNCRCIFCSVDYIGYRNRFLETAMLKARLSEMAALGVKSVMFAGEGEPFLHRDMAGLILHARAAGLDVALTTNGILMKPGIPEEILGATAWIKVSCNAGSPESYAEVHQTKAADFDRVIANLAHAVLVKRENNHTCTLGIQMILLPQNADTVERLAATARDIGLDYLVIKAYTRHSRNRHEIAINYDAFDSLREKAARYSSDTFSVIFRAEAMQTWDSGERGYDQCLALPFWAHIDAGGNVWGCGAHLEDERFLFGKISSQTFRQIWEGRQRAEAMERFAREFDIYQCRLNCRMSKVNCYLWELRHPGEHANFI